MEIKTIDVRGFVPALKAMRLPYNSTNDSLFTFTGEVMIFGEKDMSLMQALIRRGDSHSKVMRGIVAWAEITGTRKWWSECDTYRMGRERLCSASTMHQIGQRPFDVNDFETSDFVKECLTPTSTPRYLSYKQSLKYTDEEITNWQIMKEGGMTCEEISSVVSVPKSVIENCILYDGLHGSSEYSYELRKVYKLEKDIEYLNALVQIYNETKDSEILNDIKNNLPEGYLQKRVDMFSYQCLRNIWLQRRNHRLPEWHEFIYWIKTLPYSEELIFIE